MEYMHPRGGWNMWTLYRNSIFHQICAGRFILSINSYSFNSLTEVIVWSEWLYIWIKLSRAMPQHTPLHSANPLRWCHNDRDGVPNHRRLHCLLKCLFRCRWKKKSKFCITGLVRGIHREPLGSPQKWSVTRKMLQFDDITMHKHSP